MKAEVIKQYIDKETGVFNAVGTTVELTDERFAEIEKKGHFLKAIEETTKKTTKKTVKETAKTE